MVAYARPHETPCIPIGRSSRLGRLQANPFLSARRSIRTDVPASEGGRLDSVKHRRGCGTLFRSRIPALPGYSLRLGPRSRIPGWAGLPPGFSNRGSASGVVRLDCGNVQSPQRVASRLAPPVIDSDLQSPVSSLQPTSGSQWFSEQRRPAETAFADG